MPEIPEILEEFISNALKKEKIYSMVGTAKNVDEVKRICDFTPIGDEADRFDVRLQSAESQTLGLVLIPKEGSFIIISFMNRTQAFVSLTSELEKVLVDTDLFQFNGGDNDGLVKIGDLIAKLNNLENDINNLKSIFSAWAPVANDGGAALKGLLATYSGDTFVPTLQTELEDTKVTH